jgi:hypothetical protein
MPRLIKVSFTGHTAYLRPCHDGVQSVAPDAASRAGHLLEQAILQATGTQPGYHQSDTWTVPLEKLTPDTCRQISRSFRELLLQEQRRLSDLAAALGDPRPDPEPVHVEEEVEAEIRMPPDPEEELRRFREEVDRMLRRRSGSAQG